MSVIPKTTLDYIEGIEVPGEVFSEPSNEYYALSCLWKGLTYLADNIAASENEAIEAFTKNGHELARIPFREDPARFEVHMYGRLPEPLGPRTPLLTMGFHWYAVSACQFVRLVGSIAHRHDASRPLSKAYAESVIPEVIAFRDKVAAHFAWASESRRDNDAERMASILPLLGFSRNRITVGGISVQLRGDSGASSSESISEWSLTDVHARLCGRYLPPGATES